MPIETIETRRLYRQIADQISRLIEAGEYTPGMRLPAERMLAGQLKVSRPSVREALIALEVEGWVDIRGGTGVFVLDRVPETIKSGDRDLSSTPVPAPARAAPPVGPIELLDARDVVEPEIAAWAARSATDETISTLSGILGDMVCCSSADPLHMEYDHRFHAALATATGNAALLQVMETLWAMRLAPLYVQLQNHFHNEVIWQQAILEHREILEAVKTRDAKSARTAMHRHIHNARKRYISNWQEN
jgi:DNA-binding FadR family transcriptional regulator